MSTDDVGRQAIAPLTVGGSATFDQGTDAPRSPAPDSPVPDGSAPDSTAPDRTALDSTAPGTPRPFTHTDPGTPEWRWLQAPQWDGVARLDLDALLSGVTRVVVAAAHPDDETLGAGLLLSALGEAEIEVVVLVATAGEGSHPDSRTWTPELLASVRRQEVATAVHTMAPTARLVQLDLPDSGLADHEDRLVDELTSLAGSSTLLVAPWSHDGHADHDTLGRAATTCALATGARLLQYPLWLWHWGQPDDLPWERAVALDCSPAQHARREEALRCHRSQVEPLSPLPGDEAVVGADVLTRARRLQETYLVADRDVAAHVSSPSPDQDPSVFDDMYATPDPWGFASSFYEARKRDLLMAMLRRPRYARALEVGCADGHVTAVLAERCDQVTALDVSAEAVARVEERDLADCTVVQGAAPWAIPEGPFDLVLLSEVGYFMTAADWLSTLRHCRARLAPDGELVLVHWQHDTSDIPLDGRLVHAQAASMLDLPRTAAYADADVAIDVYGGPVSIASGERA